jgi:hypothetical protein
MTVCSLAGGYQCRRRICYLLHLWWRSEKMENVRSYMTSGWVVDSRTGLGLISKSLYSPEPSGLSKLGLHWKKTWNENTVKVNIKYIHIWLNVMTEHQFTVYSTGKKISLYIITSPSWGGGYFCSTTTTGPAIDWLLYVFSNDFHLIV